MIYLFMIALTNSQSLIIRIVSLNIGPFMTSLLFGVRHCSCFVHFHAVFVVFLSYAMHSKTKFPTHCTWNFAAYMLYCKILVIQLSY